VLRDSDATKREEAGRQVIVLDDMSEKDPDGNLPGTLGLQGLSLSQDVRIDSLHHYSLH